ncbi:MAG: hypothetical protein LQ352_001637 [Teloschistes flavicans]|nr:MAG: hypothetical protein LQ352_001637 [Teloschistes flavicans]
MSGYPNVATAYPSELMNGYNGDSLQAIAILFIVLTTVCVAIRVYARRVGNVKWGLDDSLIIPSTVFCLALCTCALGGYARLASSNAPKIDLSDRALGYHEAAILATHPEKLIRKAKFLMVAPLLYLNAVLFPKLAILATYLRIFTVPAYRISCWTLAIFLVVNWLTFTVACFLMCRPLAYLWDKTIVGGHCFDINLFYRWSAFPNIVTDVAMLVLPLPVVWKLHTSNNIKVGLTLMFAAGGIGLLTSILRFAGYFFHSPTSDTTYAGVYLYIYVVCESGMYLVAACLLTYKPLAKLFRKDGPLSINRTRFKSMTWGVSDNSSRASTGTANMPLRNSRKDRFEPLEETGSRATKSSRETDFV